MANSKLSYAKIQNDLEYDDFVLQELKQLKEIELMKRENEVMVKEKDFNEESKYSNEEYTDMTEYKNFITDGLYDESFLLLEENVAKINSKILKNKHIRDFVVEIFALDFFDNVLSKEQLVPFAESISNNFKNKSFLSDTAPKLSNFVEQYQLNILFVSLVQVNKFDQAGFYIPLINKNMEEIPNTIKNIVEKNNIESLRYLCENMDNIDFNSGELLKIVSPMKSPALKMLIEEFGFDINKNSYDTPLDNKDKKTINTNIVHHTLIAKQLSNFEFLYSKYANQIQLNKEAVISNKSYNIFDIVSGTSKEIDIYSILLDNKDLKKNHMEIITKALFKDDKTVAEAVKFDVYYKLFSHPNFDMQVVNWNQNYFIYGLLAKISTVANASGEGMAKNYLSVLEAYITSNEDNELPDAKNFHVLGGAVFVANQYNSKSATDAAIMIIKRYPHYINIPNPDGVLPIDQVEVNSDLYRILANNGAIIPEPPQSFWRGLLNRNKNKLQAEAKAIENEPIEVSQTTTNIIKLNEKIIKDFKGISKYIDSDLCDPTIKFKVENMYLKTKKLLSTIMKHEIEMSYDDIHFLSENFSRYLNKSLSAYITILEADEEFSVSGADDTVKNNKLLIAKNMCENHITLLTEQLGLISDNASNYMTINAEKELKVNTRYLDKKFKP